MGCIVKYGHLCDGRCGLVWKRNGWIRGGLRVLRLVTGGAIDVTGLLRTMLNEPSEDGTIDSLSDRLTELTDHRLTVGHAKCLVRCIELDRDVLQPISEP